MSTLRTELGNQLAADGWRFSERRGDAGGAWWADEEWVIESAWPPQGFRLYLTFLVDPAYDGVRPRGRGVWAVGASRLRPEDAAGAARDLILPAGQRWSRHLPRFVAALGRLRAAHVDPFSEPAGATRKEPA